MKKYLGCLKFCLIGLNYFFYVNKNSLKIFWKNKSELEIILKHGNTSQVTASVNEGNVSIFYKLLMIIDFKRKEMLEFLKR